MKPRGTYKIRGDKVQLVVTIGKSIERKPKRYYKTIPICKESSIQKQLKQFYFDCISAREYVCETFDDLLIEWSMQARKNQKKSTFCVNERVIKKNFGVFQGLALDDITLSLIKEWLEYLELERGLSPKTIRNNYSLLHSILEYAVYMEWLDTNQSEHVRLPKKTHSETASYSLDEVKALLQAMDEVSDNEQNYKVAVLLGLFGGLRRGEMCGLNVDDVDLENGTINIQRTRMQEKGYGIFEDTPKTEKSRRIISLPDHVMAEIRFLLYINERQKRLL